MEKNPKKLLVILGIIVVIVLIIIVAVIQTKKSSPNTGEQTGTPAASEETGAPTEETSTPGVATTTDANAIEGVGEKVDMKDAVAVIPGSPNLVTKDNKVVTEAGVVAANNATPMSDEAPKQTAFLDKTTLSESVVKLEVGNNKFSPSEFTVKAGAPTTFSLTGADSFSHVIVFDDSSLSAIAILVGPGQTKAITFNAPVKAGTYTFRCDSPEHSTNGETGKMIVK